jgi:hypothetical protein
MGMKIRLLAALLSTLAPCMAQGDAENASSVPYVLLSYPEDKDRVIAMVNGQEVSLEDLASHIEERHRPGFREFLATDAGNLYFRSGFVATWVRQYADIVALKSEARYRDLNLADADAFLAQALKTGFENWLQVYLEERRREGRPLPVDQDRIDALLTDYQNEYGLETEVRGWLNFHVSGEATDEEVRKYHTDNANIFGGRVTLAHILVYTRDPITGIRLDGEPRERAEQRLGDALARLREDGSNFGDVAKLLSDDRRSGERGGVFPNVARFDPRLPANLCRTVWYLRDGEVSEPIETRFGTHIIKRISFQMNQFVLFTERIVPEVRATMREHRQEELLFDLRERRRVELLY